MGISHSTLAIAIGVGPETIAEIVNGNLAITPAISIRLGDFFGQSGEFWHGIQMECDSRNPVRPNTRANRIRWNSPRWNGEIDPYGNLILEPA